MKVSVFFTLSAHQILLYYSFRFFDDSHLIGKRSANLFFFSLYLFGEKQDFFKNPFSKALDFPHASQHHVDGTTVHIGPPWPSDSYQNANIVSCHRRFCQNITWLNFKPKYQQLCSEEGKRKHQINVLREGSSWQEHFSFHLSDC